MTRRWTPAAVWIVALGLGPAGGCDPSPATQLVVVVDSDLSVPGELATVEAHTLGPDGEILSEQRFELVGSEDEAGQARFTLPMSFGVVPQGGDADRRLEVRLTGFAPGSDEPLVRRRAVTGFVKGSSLLLPMFLARSCVDATCPDDRTCSRSGCVDPEVPTSELVHVDPGDELSIFDGGVPDADAGDADADAGGVTTCPSSCDGGCIERACTTGETCVCDDEPCNCRLSCEPSGCDARCRKATCVVDGDGTDRTTVTCETDTDCRVDGRGSDDVAVQCNGGARCAVDCRDASACELSCGPGSECLVRCGEAGSCRITDCTGMQRECDGEGEVLVCGRSCP